MKAKLHALIDRLDECEAIYLYTFAKKVFRMED